MRASIRDQSLRPQASEEEAPGVVGLHPPVLVAPAVVGLLRDLDLLRRLGDRSRRSGLWVSATVTDALWPAEDGRTRPLMPLRRGHLAMLVAAGFLDNLQLEADGSRILRAPWRPWDGET